MRYGKEMRERVLKFLASGGSKAEAAKRYEVSRTTVFVWAKQPKDHQAQKPGPRDSYKFDRQVLARLVEAEPDLMLKEMARRLGVSVNAVHHALQQMKITRKKNAALRSKSPT